jgi:hypothetical protein
MKIIPLVHRGRRAMGRDKKVEKVDGGHGKYADCDVD